MLPLHTLLTAAFVTYSTAQQEDARAESLAAWQALLRVDQGFDMCRFMSSESEMLTWKAEGLPADGLSLQNAIAILHSQLSPLIIDPSTQASEWCAGIAVVALALHRL